MNEFRQMTNGSIRIGISNNLPTMKILSILGYKQPMKRRNVLSYYKLCAISEASGIISCRNKSIKRGRAIRDPYVKKTQRGNPTTPVALRVDPAKL